MNKTTKMTPKKRFAAVVPLLLACCHTPAFGQQPGEAANPTDQPVAVSPDAGAADQDQAKIREAIASYVDAFNQADAKALAMHFSAAGELVTTAGNTLRGHSELESGLTEYFKQSPQAKLELIDTRVNLISPSVAIESGYARVLVPEQAPSESQYEAVHVKTDQGWKIDRSKDLEVSDESQTDREQLQPLAWMIGTWVDQGEQSAVQTTARWTKNGHFIVRSFKVFNDGNVGFEGTEVIGWDASNEMFRSWTFDSDGGFSVGRWSVLGNRWSVDTLTVLSDGTKASATHLYDVIDQDSFEFSSIGRQVDGELVRSIPPVHIVRVSE
ncbi:nuclear transport factor 2 family protein [Stieleria sp. TO1_6]|uniref:YybH family protein n=1 Tax=Stieleria tagensis TaxID=2956795 RepID=UPI00209B589C|nr:nuclear transport factor 2 family protein [Stieleria tagensis]MCO8122812.1 nuclear transport factor 2 family protein [Stieleria tagensis]